MKKQYSTIIPTSNSKNDSTHRIEFPLSPLCRRISSIKVGQRARKGLENIDSLVESIKELGLIQPIVIDKNNKLLAGYRRLEACKRLGWKEMPVTICDSKDPLSIELHENTVREDFKFSARMALLERIERQRIGHRTGKGVNLSPFQKEEKGKKSRDIVSEYTGVSQGQLSKEKRLWQIITENPKFELLIEKIDNNEISVHNALEIVQESINNDKPVDGLISNTEKFQAMQDWFIKSELYSFKSAQKRCVSMFEYNFVPRDPLLYDIGRFFDLRGNLLYALAEIKPELLLTENDRRTVLSWIVIVEALDKWLDHWWPIFKGPERSALYRPADDKFNSEAYHGSEQDRIESEASINILYQIGHSELADDLYKLYIKDFGTRAKIDNINKNPIREFEQLTKEQLDTEWSNILERRMTLINKDTFVSNHHELVQIFVGSDSYHNLNIKTYKLGVAVKFMFPMWH